MKLSNTTSEAVAGPQRSWHRQHHPDEKSQRGTSSDAPTTDRDRRFACRSMQVQRDRQEAGKDRGAHGLQAPGTAGGRGPPRSGCSRPRTRAADPTGLRRARQHLLVMAGAERSRVGQRLHRPTLTIGSVGSRPKREAMEFRSSLFARIRNCQVCVEHLPADRLPAVEALHRRASRLAQPCAAGCRLRAPRHRPRKGFGGRP